MDQMMADISAMGGELFVMDDGWFGRKYPRNDDHCGLGDWEVNTENCRRVSTACWLPHAATT